MHPAAAADEVERARHTAFLALHVAPSLLVLAAAPLRLAAGIPGPLEFAALLASQVPMLAALAVTRGVSLRTGTAIAAVGIGAVTLEMGAAAARAGTGVTALALLGGACLPPLLYATASAGCAHRFARLTRRRAADAASRQRALARACGDLIVVVDRRGAVRSCETDHRSSLPLSARELSGPGLFERVHLADRPAFLQALSSGLDDAHRGAQDRSAVVIRLRTAMIASARGAFQEPVYAHVEMRLAALEAAGDDRHALCLLRDVTAQHARDTQIDAAEKAAENARMTRDRFLANVSHELRTPLNAIIGFADLLRLDNVPKDDAQRTEYAQIIAASGQHLLSVVNSILDMSKLESGSLEIEPTRFDPAALLDGCLDIVRLQAAEAGVVLVRRYDASLPPIVADECACRQIVINLLSNAVKFSARGGTVVLAARAEFGLSISVEDTGIGIAAADMPRLGEAFFQASNARSRLYQGTGLGLSLVRGLVGLHGGTMQMESAPGAGTCVTVRLPGDCRTPAAVRAPVAIRAIARRAAQTDVALQPKVKNVA